MRAVTILSKVPLTVVEPELDTYRYDCLINRLEMLVIDEPKYGDRCGHVRVLQTHVSNIARTLEHTIANEDFKHGYYRD